MKHRRKGRKLSRIKKQREALLKIMLGNLLMKEKMTTTEAKAKELKPLVEKIIGRAKKTLSGDKEESAKIIRKLSPKLPHQVKLSRLREIAGRFAARNSGYVRIFKKGRRRSDGAKMAVIEFIKKETE